MASPLQQGLCRVVRLNAIPPVELHLGVILPAARAARVQSLAEPLPLDDKGVSQLRAWCNLLIYKDCIQRRFFFSLSLATADTSSREKPLCSELTSPPPALTRPRFSFSSQDPVGDLQSMELAVSHTRSFALSNLQYVPEAEQWLQESGCGRDHIVRVATYGMTEREPKLSSPKL